MQTIPRSDYLRMGRPLKVAIERESRDGFLSRRPSNWRRNRIMAQSLILGSAGSPPPSDWTGAASPGTPPADRETRHPTDTGHSGVRHSNTAHCDSSGCRNPGHSNGNAPRHAVRHSNSVRHVGSTSHDSSAAPCHSIRDSIRPPAHGRPEAVGGTPVAARRRRRKGPEALSGNDSQWVCSYLLIRLPQKCGLMSPGEKESRKARR